MGPNLELEPVPTKLKSFFRGASLVAALSLAACSGGGGENEVLAARDEAGIENTTDDTFSPGTTAEELPTSSSSSSTSETTATSPSDTRPNTNRPVTSLTPTTRPPITQSPTTGSSAPAPTQPPTTQRPVTTTTTTTAPPPPSREPLSAPTNFRVEGSRALQCRDVPPPPGGAPGRSGRMCDVDLRATQHQARPEDSGQRIVTVFQNCAENETPFSSRDGGTGELTSWSCENSWAMSEGDPANQVGEVRGYGTMQAGERYCWFAYTKQMYYRGDGFWTNDYASETITGKICLTVDANGNITR